MTFLTSLQKTITKSIPVINKVVSDPKIQEAVTKIVSDPKVEEMAAEASTEIIDKVIQEAENIDREPLSTETTTTATTTIQSPAQAEAQLAAQTQAQILEEQKFEKATIMFSELTDSVEVSSGAILGVENSIIKFNNLAKEFTDKRANFSMLNISEEDIDEIYTILIEMETIETNLKPYIETLATEYLVIETILEDASLVGDVRLADMKKESDVLDFAAGTKALKLMQDQIDAMLLLVNESEDQLDEKYYVIMLLLLVLCIGIAYVLYMRYKNENKSESDKFENLLDILQRDYQSE